MSPNMTCQALPSFSPRLTVAKRKEALELRKVSQATEFSCIRLNIFTDVLHVLDCMNIKISVLFSDNETTDGKEKARPYQRQLEPLEKPHPSPYRKRCESFFYF